MTITQQIDSIRDRFNTKKIFDKTSKASLTENEIESIISIIKNERKDGVYEVNDEILVELKNGACSIKDNLDE